MNLWSELNQFRISQISKYNGSWIRTPTVLQMENTECGAAALSIILQHYGKYVPLAQLREQCGVSRDGSDAANIILAANLLGLKGRGFKKGLVKLKKVNLPVILFWEFNHFLVLEGFVGNRVMLNDPAIGPRSVSEEEFDMSYTGVTLAFETTNEFIREGKAPQMWPIVFRRMLSERFAIIFTLLSF